MFEPTTQIPETSEPKFETIPLSELEIAGAVSAKVMHDLSTLISGIVGNAEYAAKNTNDPAGLAKALEAINSSANAVAMLLGQCLPLQRSISNAALLIDAAEMAERIAEGAGLTPCWRATPPSGLSGQVKVQPRWLAAAIWQLTREVETSRGEFEFSTGPAVFPVSWQGANPNPGRELNLFQINLRYRADEELVTKESHVTPARPSLLAALELIRRCKGQIQFHAKPPGRQEIFVLIPMV